MCEAEICPSGVKGMYEQTEGVLDAAIRAPSPGQLIGLGVATFEGSHLAIREPYQTLGDIPLNRVGETGYNNPVPNIYRAQ